uniref:Uncharacterized protein n=1 Tax=Lotus japonicus TaxID=34305 RepID=I3SJY5_LOTJA|nr:unknown [Lotus japonicus]
MHSHSHQSSYHQGRSSYHISISILHLQLKTTPITRPQCTSHLTRSTLLMVSTLQLKTTPISKLLQGGMFDLYVLNKWSRTTLLLFCYIS